MLVAVVGQVFCIEHGGVVAQAHIAVKLREARVAVVVQQVAEDLDTVVDDDVDILIGIETIGILVEIGTVAEEIG